MRDSKVVSSLYGTIFPTISLRCGVDDRKRGNVQLSLSWRMSREKVSLWLMIGTTRALPNYTTI